MRLEVIPKLNPDSMRFLCLKSYDKILQNNKKMTKEQIVETIRNLRDEMERYF